MIDAVKKYGQYLASRARKIPIEMIVVHSSAGRSFAGAWATLLLRGLGYHALVPDEDEFGHGDVVKCVPDSRYTFHAGNSYGPREERLGLSRKQGAGSKFIAGCSVNDYTLGISFVNANDGKDAYSEKQHQACVKRCVEWAVAYPSIQWLSTHYWVSPHRKNDPLGYDMNRLLKDVNLELTKVKRAPLKLWKPK